MTNVVFLAILIASQHQQYSPTVADYEEKIEHVMQMTKGVFSDSTWDEVFLKAKSGSQATPWRDMSRSDKDMFMIVVGLRTINSMLRIEEYWAEENTRFDNPNHKLVVGSGSRPATQKEVIQYLDKLKKIRKSFADEFKASSESFFKKYESTLTVQEVDSLRKKIEDAR